MLKIKVITAVSDSENKNQFWVIYEDRTQPPMTNQIIFNQWHILSRLKDYSGYFLVLNQEQKGLNMLQNFKLESFRFTARS